MCVGILTLSCILSVHFAFRFQENEFSNTTNVSEAKKQIALVSPIQLDNKICKMSYTFSSKLGRYHSLTLLVYGRIL